MEFQQGSVEDMELEFWRSKRVLITGHTGFKGAWLCLWLKYAGAQVTGYALDPPTDPSFFSAAGIGKLIDRDIRGDILDLANLTNVLSRAQPEIVFHMAAQSLVRRSYKDPIETFSTNVMGTVNLLEALRLFGGARAAVMVTSDKCYENREWLWGYRENDPMGGLDPYSASKGCSEIVTAAYRNSFFANGRLQAAVASARAGNVIGGGDWAEDRLVPDCIRAYTADRQVLVRNPHAIRPWQHVLEPLSGYMLLAKAGYEKGRIYAEGWNFGPDDTDAKPVQWVVEKIAAFWGNGASWRLDNDVNPPEAFYLKLDCSKARSLLAWKPRWTLETALKKNCRMVSSIFQES